MTSPIRLQADHERLRALAAASGEMIVLLEGPTAALPQADVELRYTIARSERYPADLTRQTRLRIALPGRYPFQPPTATVLTPVWHPNVFPSGTICLGTKWLASEGLDLFVQRLARPMNRQIEVIPTGTLEALRRYAWPGNVRELANLIERAMILSRGRTLEVPLDDLARRRPKAGTTGNRGAADPAAERADILRALERANWVLAGPRGAAARLGLRLRGDPGDAVLPRAGAGGSAGPARHGARCREL